jgi:hypothetical protein
MRFLDRLLDAGAVRLPLPAHEGAAVKFDGEREAGQSRPRARVGIANTRSSSSRRHERQARARARTKIGRIAPARCSAIVSDGDRRSASPASRPRSSHRMDDFGRQYPVPLAVELEESPGHRVERAHLPLDLHRAGQEIEPRLGSCRSSRHR